MPTSVPTFKAFARLCQNPSASRVIVKNVKIQQQDCVKLKLRTTRQLYTLRTSKIDVAEELLKKLPKTITVQRIK